MNIDNQQGDVKLFQTIDDGEIDITDGIAAMDSGLATAAYLAMFGGNEEDNGIGDNKFQWWGNLDETEPSKKYRSQTQFLLKSIPAISSNLLRIEEAVKSDLDFFIEINASNEVKVEVTIPGLNKVNISGSIIAEGVEESFSFTENWKSET